MTRNPDRSTEWDRFPRRRAAAVLPKSPESRPSGEHVERVPSVSSSSSASSTRARAPHVAGHPKREDRPSRVVPCAVDASHSGALPMREASACERLRCTQHARHPARSGTAARGVRGRACQTSSPARRKRARSFIRERQSDGDVEISTRRPTSGRNSTCPPRTRCTSHPASRATIAHPRTSRGTRSLLTRHPRTRASCGDPCGRASCRPRVG